MNSSFIPSDWIPTDKIDRIWEFLKAIDWREPWLMSVVAFHVITFLFIILLRRHTNLQAVVFFCLLGLVYSSEYLNGMGEKHWRKFSKEQYFDSTGLFISVVLSVPVLFNCFTIVIIWLWTAFNMLVVVGRGKIREKRKMVKEEATREEKKKKK